MLGLRPLSAKAAWYRESGPAPGEPHLGDPVALPPGEAVVLALAIEVARLAAQQRRVHAVESVDADDRVEAAVDAAGDQRHDAAARADVELGGARAVRVLRDERGIL